MFKAAYAQGEKTALDTFGLTKEALAPLIAGGLMTAARAAIPMLARGAASLGRSVAQQLPGMAAQTGVSMAVDKMTQPGPAPAKLPGMVDQGHLPGMYR